MIRLGDDDIIYRHEIVGWLMQGRDFLQNNFSKRFLSQALTFLHFSKSFLSNTFTIAFLLRPFFKLITTIKSFICFHSFSEGHTGSTLQWSKGKMLASVKKVDIEFPVLISENLKCEDHFWATCNIAQIFIVSHLKAFDNKFWLLISAGYGIGATKFDPKMERL